MTRKSGYYWVRTQDDKPGDWTILYYNSESNQWTGEDYECDDNDLQEISEVRIMPPSLTNE